MKTWRKGFKPRVSDYEPRQRGQVAMGQKTSGNRWLKDGDMSYEECPWCGFLLRVRRGKTGPATFWCPCGFEDDASRFSLPAE